MRMRQPWFLKTTLEADKIEVVIEFSKHAKERINYRKISQKDVLGTIENPDRKALSFRGRKLHRKRIGSKILEVVTKKENIKIIVITAYYLKE